MTQVGRKTPLIDRHWSLGARMTDYAGWQMPLQYESIKAEHLAVRETAGLFDVSHMGEIEISGESAAEFAHYILTRSFEIFSPDRAIYSLMCNDQGGTVDDLIVYPLTAHRFLFVVNAANTERDYEHIQAAADRFSQMGYDRPTVANQSNAFAQIALQGPASAAMLSGLISSAAVLKRHHFSIFDDHQSWLVSRTGYTGEDGFEIFLPPSEASGLWDHLQAAGARPAGLGARDSLRLEAGLPLYGHELSLRITPLEAGLGKFVDLDKPAPGFIGQDALLAGAPQRRLVGLVAAGQAIPRAGYLIYDESGVIGEMTSGLYSPTLERGIGLAMVQTNAAARSFYEVEIRGKREPFAKSRLPFVRRRHQSN